jgi:hypothetical protein
MFKCIIGGSFGVLFSITILSVMFCIDSQINKPFFLFLYEFMQDNITINIYRLGLWAHRIC